MSRSRIRLSSPVSQRGSNQDLSMMMGAIGFPESSQRTTADHDPNEQPEPEEEEEEGEENVPDDRQDTFPPSPSPTSIDFLSFPRQNSPIRNTKTLSPGPSRSRMMRLENILNDASIEDIYETRPRSRSLGQMAHNPEDTQVDGLPSTGVFMPSSLPGPVHLGRSLSPSTTVERESNPGVKKKKVKMHRCPECQKEFPRPSGLRTHMNIHTKEKPFGCTYPGCSRTFSVVSNAKRHMRTHGLGPVDDPGDEPSVPYVVGFEAPMVAEPQHEDVAGRDKMPYQLRWIQGSEASSNVSSSAMMGMAKGSGSSGFGLSPPYAEASGNIAGMSNREGNVYMAGVGGWPSDSDMPMSEGDEDSRAERTSTSEGE